MRVFKLGIWFLFALVSLVFFASLAGQNQDRIGVTLFNYTTGEYQKWIIIVAAFFLGAFFATIFFIIQLVILETKFLRLRRAHSKLERAMGAVKASTAPAALDDPSKRSEPRILDADDV